MTEKDYNPEQKNAKVMKQQVKAAAPRGVPQKKRGKAKS